MDPVIKSGLKAAVQVKTLSFRPAVLVGSKWAEWRLSSCFPSVVYTSQDSLSNIELRRAFRQLFSVFVRQRLCFDIRSDVGSTCGEWAHSLGVSLELLSSRLELCGSFEVSELMAASRSNSLFWAKHVVGLTLAQSCPGTRGGLCPKPCKFHSRYRLSVTR